MLFEFREPSVFTMPENDTDKYTFLVRDGAGEYPKLKYLKLDEMLGFSLPDGEKDKDVLLWNYEKSTWNPARTEEVEVVVNVTFENGILKQYKKKMRVIQETTDAPAYTTVVEFGECEGVGGGY